ncbi:MAG TPA: MBL fold metallo-hydrolase [Fulvivirga sp.]|nr:MBL fold metallo-hydrolase [Fulvivirga sp.]
MVKMRLFLLIILCAVSLVSFGQDYEKDSFETTAGKLDITFIGHGSLMFEIDNKVIHIDPSSREGDYTKLPKADLILITHHHGDHCDATAVDQIKKLDTKVITTQLAIDKLGFGQLLSNDEKTLFEGITIEALPAYNLVHKRENGEFFHPKGTCNSYLLTIGGKRIFIGGDTENTPEMKALKNIDIAFLPMNLPYTMTPEMVADAAKAFRPKILYPYHYGNTDTGIIVDLMKGEAGIETRIRKME